MLSERQPLPLAYRSLPRVISWLLLTLTAWACISGTSNTQHHRRDLMIRWQGESSPVRRLLIPQHFRRGCRACRPTIDDWLGRRRRFVEGLLQLLVINLSFPVLEDLSALVVHGQPEDDNIALMPDVEGDVVTLTHLPRSRWQTLLNLDVIQVSSSTFLCISYALTHFG